MTILVSRDFPRKILNTVSVCDYAFAVDEPPDIGGEDAGFTPRDVFDSVLGACKALKVFWYARRKQMPLEDVQVSVDRDDSVERQGNHRLRVTLARCASGFRHCPSHCA